MASPISTQAITAAVGGMRKKSAGAASDQNGERLCLPDRGVTDLQHGDGLFSTE
jgi:hypothetical protein